MTRKFGIDISSYQRPSEIYYDLLAQNIDFAILRAGFTGWGTGESYYKDDTFEAHYRELRKRQVPLGGYWYSCANTPLEGVNEAKELLSLVAGKDFQYPLIMDVEDQHHQAPTSMAKLTETVIAFCETIEQAGYYAMIYSSTWWLKNELDLTRLAPYDLWVAQWSKIEPPIRHGIWQYTSGGKIAGFAGRLDCNFAYRDYPKLIQKAGLNHLGNAACPTRQKSVDELANEVLQGLWGNGQERKDRLKKAGYDYEATQARVNEKLARSKKKSLDAIAREVIRGDWGNGGERRKRLKEAGYDYEKVQARVNQILN